MIPTPQQPLVDELLSACTFPEPGTPLACAVSGGPDSSALLVLARAAGCTVTAHHVDHGARAESASEGDIVAALCERFGAEFVRHRTVVDPGPNFEARARHARQALLPRDIATGHTLDDRAETVLINLLRGAARTGLSPLRDRQRHPIIGLRRQQTHALCEALEVPVIHDPMNDDPAFLRTRIRSQLLPLMTDIADRDVAALLDRQVDVLGEEDDFLDGLAAVLDSTDAKAIAAAPPVLARRALRAFIASEWSISHPPGAESIARVLDVAHGRATSCEIEGGHRVHRTNQKLRVESPMGKVTPP